MNNFWQKLPKPFFVLAPMDEVTDVVFRSVVAKTAKPNVLFTEFVNVDGLNSAGHDALIPRLKFDQLQRPIVAQIWGLKPKNFEKAASEIVRLGFDGIDINMGCPDKKVFKIGACSALINNPNLAKEIILAAKQGAGKLPVSVKTRIGVKEIQTDKWISFLLQFDLAALTVHGRTVKEQSLVPAHWDEIRKAVKIRDSLSCKTLIIGNGDVKNKADGLLKAKEYGVDGVMIGRGIFKDLWAFSDSETQQDKDEAELLSLLLKHTQYFDQTWGEKKNFAIMRKFFKIYTLGLDNASNLREQLMTTKSPTEVEEIIDNYLSNQSDA